MNLNTINVNFFTRTPKIKGGSIQIDLEGITYFRIEQISMSGQSTSHIFMVYPTSFGFNEETATSNYFQSSEAFGNSSRIQAQAEFDNAVNILRSNGINVTVFKDSSPLQKPDAVFPNNWISIHPEGYVLYPMEAVNRRSERTPEIYASIAQNLDIICIADLSHHETERIYLEGTGSIIFDHLHKKAYASISSRTNEELFKSLCSKLNYKPISFSSKDKNGNPVYHTNVLMAIGTGYAVLCSEAIGNDAEKEAVENELKNDGIEIIRITLDQMHDFAGNMIELQGMNGEKMLIMSKTANMSLTSDQINRIQSFAKPVVIDVSTIEKFGGGSIRCMIAELFF